MKNKVIQKFFTILLGLMMVGPGWAMSGSSSENMAGQGSPFTNAYDYSFTTSGTTVNISFTENDNYTGLVAYLWKYTNNDFAETQMNVSEHTATIALTNQTPGTKLTLACKFAYSGGMSVTKKFEYTVEGGDTPTPPTPPSINWSDFLGDATNTTYSNKYKVEKASCIQNIANVQSGTTAVGIYLGFVDADFGEFRIGDSKMSYDVQGAGVWLHVSNFTEEITEVKVMKNNNTEVRWTFHVYYAGGTTGGGDTPEPEPTGNLFDPAKATITTSFNNWDWAVDNTSTASYDAATGKITTNIDGAKNAQWQAQVKLNTGLTTLDATKKIYFTCKIKPSVTFNGTTIKMFDNAQIYYEDKSVSLTADTESTIILSGKNAVASSNGVIVFDFGYAPANTTIEIYDIEIGYGEIEDDSKPSAAPPAPAYPANQVKAVYSATYGADCSFGHWNSGPTCVQEDYGKKFHTTGNGYFGLEFSAKNCSNMEALHMDVWFPEAGSFRVVPIWGGTEYGVTVTVTEAESKAWKSVDIPFTQGDWTNINNWSSVNQLKIDNVPNKTFWLNNIYFYTTQEQEPEVITETTWWDEIRTVTINNVDYAVLCSVTRHENKTITFHIETTGWITGLVPQVNINNVFKNLNGYTDINWKADYTTVPADGTFETGDVLTCYLYFAYSGGAANLPNFTYTVGAENDKPAIAVTGVTINQSAPTLAIGETLQLTATVAPSFVENKNVTWTTTDANTVSVTNGGLIKAIAAGTATIKATSVADNTKFGEVLVTVQAALEDAVFYGNGYIERGDPAHLVAINYTITRTSERKLAYALDFSENVEGMVMQVKDAVAYNNLVLDETKMHATFTSTGTYTDGVKITPEHFIYFGGPRIELGDYVIGSTNEQPNKLIALNEVVANALTNDETVDAVIARSFTANNLYTLALPFDMTADQVAETFRTCTMYKLEDSYWKVENENMYIRFAPVTEFEANTPILFTPTEDIENAVAKDVTIKNGDCYTSTTLVTFHGTYSKMDLAAPNYILAADKYLYPVVGDEYYINGMRGYFSWGTSVSQAPKMARVILHEEITTDNALVPAAQGATKKVMENGRFVIIRDGKSYNAQGLIIQ